MFWPAGFWGTPPAPLIQGGVGLELRSAPRTGQRPPLARSPQAFVEPSGFRTCPREGDLLLRCVLLSRPGGPGTAVVSGGGRSPPRLPRAARHLGAQAGGGSHGSRRCTAPSGGVSAPGAAPAMGRRVGSVAVAAGATPDAQQNFLLRGWGPGPGGACPWSGGRTCFLCLLSGADTGEGWAAWGSVCGSRGVTVWRPRKCSGQCRC